MQGGCVLLLLGLWLQLSLGLVPVEEEDPAFWNRQAAQALDVAKKLQPIQTAAKNVILFLGDGECTRLVHPLSSHNPGALGCQLTQAGPRDSDLTQGVPSGMGVSTVTAARILKGQMAGKPGPETPLAMDQFPYLALSKTYNVDRNVPDSAGTTTAYLCGVKTRMKVIGVSAAARYNQCNTTYGNEVTSVMNRAKKAGKSVGVVTTTRVQHASPAGAYAHTVNRNWYSDAQMPAQAKREGCQDIATQLVYNMDIDVILGGGRKYMFPEGTPDPEYPQYGRQNGVRKDKRNLVQEWQAKHQEGCHGPPTPIPSLQFTTRPISTGLFEPGDMVYDIFRDHTTDPSLEEMTEAALLVLSRNPRGFFLFVEGGRIDHGHHESIAYRALTEAVMFDNAIAKASQLTSEADTLTLVTADHSHVFTFGGYPLRGTSIFGLADGKAEDGGSYTSLLYGNGPGFRLYWGSRPDVDETESMDPNYKQQAAVPLGSETHGGEDVAVFARGPWAYLMHGVQEQTFVAHVMAFAACVEPYTTDCNPKPPSGPSDAAHQAACLSSLALLVGVLLQLLVPALH
ncbi:hypothetical protein MJG53_002578 [Ovis ammon polii x Ovis aries]|uniref:Uncharacterized protein n=1 Tax=Ovis ammon polii x Ovis aries TaxID=2918886 RepID=A0ACB9VED1_9CETA|nr:hypothetical protein MJG53_002578 [Ovis ammon polii x Ovis aries]